ncbi:hypothetical protein I3843_05G122600 [Carya illinoinensis]|uniref:EF-hand domain-containing protein n=1 Tax=Carya illinoinensis TaxID=32201 RepID=A0A8T1QII0_CARIL|nr:probable calcium-binding protein CML45 [Carya illinoinensis]KAG2707145.1 hypothetical protein I3760_05G134500 [Carya illinoinensis]KAG6654267.1 hypothetical protein CIPAW_05G133300 [Carya illinoinensis]KAG6713033.1 hypothetical protein I3842_05G129800 [Carya illinoinensis]KAG7979283.1 hypothetical protein I3843_05G122600 [Carya illinoinensis]
MADKSVANMTTLFVRIRGFFTSFHVYVRPLLGYVHNRWKVWTKMISLRTEILNQQFVIRENAEDEKLSRKKVKKVMEILGLNYDPIGGDQMQERIGADELSQLFEEDPACLDEVREAFEVFDANKDGFIDARELQKVLCNLGLEKGSEVEECRKMIRAVDQNGDELIDFSEFVKFMEKSFN